MSDYCRARFSAVYSENSDYSSAEFQTQWPDYELTPDEGAYNIIDAATGGTTYETGILTTCTLFAVQNTDTTNYVTVTWTDSGSSSNSQRVPAGGILVVPDIAPGTDPTLTANTATVRCKVFIAGT